MSAPHTPTVAATTCSQPQHPGKAAPRLPGNAAAANADLARMIRVDHAGEYGAKRIYEGQIAILGHTADGPILRHMAEQELEHLRTFQRLITERRVRPTALLPFWHIAGFVVGAGTALIGRRAAMACTVAVEEVIDEHYARQYASLGPEESALKADIERFRQEELEHRDIGLANEAEQAPAYPLLSAAIKTGSRLAIWLAERI